MNSHKARPEIWIFTESHLYMFSLCICLFSYCSTETWAETGSSSSTEMLSFLSALSPTCEWLVNESALIIIQIHCISVEKLLGNWKYNWHYLFYHTLLFNYFKILKVLWCSFSTRVPLIKQQSHMGFSCVCVFLCVYMNIIAVFPSCH